VLAKLTLRKLNTKKLERCNSEAFLLFVANLLEDSIELLVRNLVFTFALDNSLSHSVGLTANTSLRFTSNLEIDLPCEGFRDFEMHFLDVLFDNCLVMEVFDVP